MKRANLFRLVWATVGSVGLAACGGNSSPTAPTSRRLRRRRPRR
jgi:hypothetical protein